MADDGSLQLSGAVDVDEAYCDGKLRNKGNNERGRGTKKQPIQTLVERKGNKRTRVVCDVTADSHPQAHWL